MINILLTNVLCLVRLAITVTQRPGCVCKEVTGNASPSLDRLHNAKIICIKKKQQAIMSNRKLLNLLADSLLIHYFVNVVW